MSYKNIIGQDMPESCLEYIDRFIEYTFRKKDAAHGIEIIENQISRGIGVKVPSTGSLKGNTIEIDCANVLGVLAAQCCVSAVVRNTRKVGFSVVVGKNIEHVGRLGFHLREIASNNMVAIGFLSTHSVMSLPDVNERVVGNNIIGIAYPFNEDAVVLDMSLGSTTVRSLVDCYKLNAKVKESVLSNTGEWIEDPEEAITRGAIKPLSNHKGGALALTIQMLLGVITGTGFIDPPDRLDQHNIHQLMLLSFDASHFDESEMRKQVNELQARYKKFHIPGYENT